MENNGLNKKVFEKVRNRVVISNLEREETMKSKGRKRALSIIAVMVVVLVGSFTTVNAMTDGALAEKVEHTIRIMFVKENGEKKDVASVTYMDKENHEIEKYETSGDGMQTTILIDKTNADKELLSITGIISGDETSMVIEEQK